MMASFSNYSKENKFRLSEKQIFRCERNTLRECDLIQSNETEY